MNATIKDVRTLSRELIKRRYLVKMLRMKPNDSQSRFYFDPPDVAQYRFRGAFMGKEVASNTRVVLFNEKAGSVAEVDSLQQALGLYLRLSLQPRVNCNELDILKWMGARWVIVAPEGIE